MSVGTVGELRQALEGLDEHLGVVVIRRDVSAEPLWLTGIERGVLEDAAYVFLNVEEYSADPDWPPMPPTLIRRVKEYKP